MNRRPEGGLRIFWLGQAGFVVDIGGYRLVIDPYLSNTLAEKYAGTPRPHIRMMPPPILAECVPFVDLVLCTHAHTDHMDPGTLPPLLRANPSAKLVVPRATRQQAVDRSITAEEHLVLARAGEKLFPLPDLSIIPTRAAHETLETDAEGNHRFLGYVIDAGSVRIWHSGDCVPFPGLESEVSAFMPDIALLPVNGRRPELSGHGVPGNFSLEEAIEIARGVGVTDVVAHHYGLFDFNTESPQTIDAAVASVKDVHLHRARTNVAFSWRGA
ncbi:MULTISPECIES: MBL fold metallo-hydrolase [unclassified Sinorhizobium]|uniref:MBL fold metallo-hydrolase n=1 Tax=unclassified Sinorhizobium TaxID=2613772 RepID=UPI00352574DB